MTRENYIELVAFRLLQGDPCIGIAIEERKEAMEAIADAGHRIEGIHDQFERRRSIRPNSQSKDRYLVPVRCLKCGAHDIKSVSEECKDLPVQDLCTGMYNKPHVATFEALPTDQYEVRYCETCRREKLVTKDVRLSTKQLCIECGPSRFVRHGPGTAVK